MFLNETYKDSNANHIDLSSLDTSSVIDMGSIFVNTTSLRLIDISSFEISQIDINNLSSMSSGTGATNCYVKNESIANILNNTCGKPSTLILSVK